MKINSIVLLRVLIGWHFLYEGIVKLYNPDWTAYGYLASAQGPFKGLFDLMLGEMTIAVIDTLNTAALVFVGITLLLGIFERVGAVVGVALLGLYYFAHPPFPGLTQLNVEGNYWLVNKVLIELVACVVLFQHPTGKIFGLSAFKKQLSKTGTA